MFKVCLYTATRFQRNQMTQDLQSLEIRDQMDDEDLSEGLDSEADDVITFEVMILIDI